MVVKTLLTLGLIFSVSAAVAEDMAAPPAATSLANLEKNCREQKKSKSVCACVVRHVNEAFKNKDLNEEQLAAIALAAKGSMVKEDDKSSDFDAMADYLAGAESKCPESSKSAPK